MYLSEASLRRGAHEHLFPSVSLPLYHSLPYTPYNRNHILSNVPHSPSLVLVRLIRYRHVLDDTINRIRYLYLPFSDLFILDHLALLIIVIILPWEPKPSEVSGCPACNNHAPPSDRQPQGFCIKTLVFFPSLPQHETIFAVFFYLSAPKDSSNTSD